MATYTADTFVGPPLRGDANEAGVIEFVGGLKYPAGVAPVTGDVLKLFRVPAGSYIDLVQLYHASWGTTVPGKIGLATQDDDAVATAHAFETSRVLPYTYLADAADSAATGVDRTVKFATDLAVTTATDTFQITLGTVSTGTAASELKFRVRLVQFPVGQAYTKTYTWNSTAAGAGVATS